MAELTEAELLHLVDRAERGTLLPAEAQQLRAAIRRYAAAQSVILSAFNAAKQVVVSTFNALQQLDLVPGACPTHVFVPERLGVSDAKRRLANCQVCAHSRASDCHPFPPNGGHRPDCAYVGGIGPTCTCTTESGAGR